MRKRLLEEIDAVVIRNVENLRWATRQNLEDAFRRFGAELDEKLSMSVEATRGAMQKAFEQRKQHAEQIDSEIEAKQRGSSHLAEIVELLRRHETTHLPSPTQWKRHRAGSGTMTTFYCPDCWAEVPESATVCPHCYTNISERISQADYTDKLIAALRHKEPMTPMRAACILGERREPKAVPALTKIVGKGKDAFVVESAVEALGKIGGEHGVRFGACRCAPFKSARSCESARDVGGKALLVKLYQQISCASAAQRIPVKRMFVNDRVFTRRIAQRNSSLFLRRQLPPRTTRPIPARGVARSPAA